MSITRLLDRFEKGLPHDAKPFWIHPEFAHCLWDVQNDIETSKVGEGISGSVYSTCCDSNSKKHCALDSKRNCNFVTKVVVFDQDVLEPFGESEFVNEYNIQRRCGELGLCPEVVASFYTANRGFLISKKAQVTLYDLLKMKEVAQDCELVKDTIKKVYEALRRLHSAKICHNDLHTENVMLDYKEMGKSKTVSDIKFIDMGRASDGNDGFTLQQLDECARQDRTDLASKLTSNKCDLTSVFEQVDGATPNWWISN